MKKNTVIVFALFVAHLFSASAGYAEKLNVWGSTTCQKRFLEPNADALKKATGISLKVNGVGTGEGLVALIDGKADVSAASEDLDLAIKSAEKVRKNIIIPKNLIYHKITTDRIVVIVNEKNPVSKLTWKQLKDMHAGKITNWKDVGGPDLPIRIITSHEGSATRMFFQKTVMNNEPYVSTAQTVANTQDEIVKVSKDPAAIGAVSYTFLLMYSENVKGVSTDPISRSLGLITKGAPSPTALKMINFMRGVKSVF